MSPPQEVDVIVVGGGAAGCVVAGRLAAADPKLEILIIENGPDNLDEPSVVQPARFLEHLRPDSTRTMFYAGRKSEHLGGRSPIVPVGNTLGGGSSINFMMYTRASASDYDDWNTEGWSAKDLLPLLKKIESYSLKKMDPKLHGSEGPLKVSYGGFRPTIMDEYLKVAQERGYEVVDDLQDLKTGHAFEQWGKWIDPETGRRSDAAHGYVHPQRERNPNLHLLCDSRVSRVVLEGKKAVGVEYVPTIKPEGQEPAPQTIKARKLVVVSAGALGSPQILERSGIGAAEVLKSAVVDQIVDLPGVGTNYQDHQLLLPAYRVTPETDTHDDFLRGVPEVQQVALKEFKEGGKGKLTTNMIDCGGKVRPNEKEIEGMGPAFRKRWDKYFADAQDKPVMFVGIVNTFLGDHSLVPPGKYITLGSYLEYPVSRGTIHITSSSPYSTPDFDPAFLSEEADLSACVWGYKLGRELARRLPFVRGELPLVHPSFANDSTARIHDIDRETAKEISAPGSITAGIAPAGVAAAADGPKPVATKGTSSAAGKHDQPNGVDGVNGTNGANGANGAVGKIEDLVYSDEDNKAVEQWVRANIATTWHSMGTLAMKPREKGGVVDPKLNVYGVENLKVADLSICPGNVGSNTYSTALLVGEKAAVLCAEHLGISLDV